MNIPSINDIPKLPFKLKENYDSIIPLKFFQTWKTKELPPLLQNNMDKIKEKNPEFEYFLFDDNDCRIFIQKHFRPDVLHAYDTLIPGAYKADLWRYCVLFICGGIYLDMRFELIHNFKLIALTEKEHFVLERNGHWMPGKHGIYNALMVCKPNNIFLFQCIRQIVKNVKNGIYGYNEFYPTGPGLLWLIHETNRNFIRYNIDAFNPVEGKYIIYNNRLIMHSMDNYINTNTEHYSILWHNKKIYK